MSAVQESCTSGDAAARRYRDERIAHWNRVARGGDRGRLGGPYRRRLADVYRLQVPPGRRVLEIGCGSGDLLAALEPSVGVGVDFSDVMLARARRRHPGLRWVHADAHELDFDESFDFIILSDLVNDLWDVQGVFERLAALARPHTRILLNSYSRLWAPPLAAARHCGLARPNLRQNWLTPEDTANLLHLAGFEVLRAWQEVLLPLPVPALGPLANRFLVKLPGFRSLALTNFTAARLLPPPPPVEAPPLVSVIVPARNEAGNVPAIFERVPEFPGGTELIFVEGHSSDNTRAAIEQALSEHPERNARLYIQTGKGKGDAVRLGFANATGDVLMILDADLTVPPEDLPRFHDALVAGRGEFINGVRLVYPMEGQAMRPLNFLGNKFFSLAFSWLLGQPIKDTLCGTKVLRRRDYEVIAANRGYFGDFDPFGDFDLLFGAAKLNLRIIDLPVRYRDRTYGTTNIQRWRHGWLLLRMVLKAAGRIKFV
ncbi:MAG: glycosyltransferase [Planctomycetia bacterium]|nr:glycosyltransferase [Planctomycetia bacterium]